MKTPRQLLFERHRSAESKLDAIRESVVANVRNAPSPGKAPAVSAPRWTLRELLRSFRWHLAGLSAAWLVVLILNADRASGPAVVLAHEKIPAPRPLLTSLQAYRRQLAELLDRPVPEPATVPPRRSQLSPPLEVV